MGEKQIITDDTKTCMSCGDFLEAGEKVYTYYGNVSGEMPQDGSSFGVPVVCSCCVGVFRKPAKEKEPKRKLHT